MASSLPAKRPHSPDSDDKEPRNHRELLKDALKADTEVRFAKLQGRQAVGTVSLSSTTPLRSEHLVEVYPEVEGTPKSFAGGEFERDRYAYQRKCIPNLRVAEEADDSLTPIEIIGYDRHVNCLKKRDQKGVKYLPVPPNLLFFEICLEGYILYSLKGQYNSNDPAMPRAAVMGGAVVAALNAWRDLEVISIFINKEAGDGEASQTIEQLFASPGTTESDYLQVKRNLILRLNQWFITSKIGENRHYFNRRPDPPKSSFFDGDVDIFLQASSHTQSLFVQTNKIADVMENISSFVGGCGIETGDLERFATKVLSKLEKWLNEDEKLVEFIPALTHKGLSVMSTVREDYTLPETIPWPRVTQFIMLNHKADLLGALMDFDLALCSCAYDGSGVRITKRAEFALKTMTCVVTPFCFEERRNRKRIVKYYKRGFDFVLLDPCCDHDAQCQPSSLDLSIRRQWDDENFNASGCPWRSVELRGDRYEEVNELQGGYPSTREDTVMICGHSYGYEFSCIMIEKNEGHTTEFFANRDNWSEAEMDEISSTPNHLRVVCRKCRFEYGLPLYLEKENPPVETAEDVIKGEKYLKFSSGWDGFLEPSFYGGGVFDSCRIRLNIEAYMTLRAQSKAERCRYILKHGKVDGYKDRFLHISFEDYTQYYFQRWKLYQSDIVDKMKKLFKKASAHNFPEATRSPIGLNPERFIAMCKSCRAWLYGYEYGTKFCTTCEERKPSAA